MLCKIKRHIWPAYSSQREYFVRVESAILHDNGKNALTPGWGIVNKSVEFRETERRWFYFHVGYANNVFDFRKRHDCMI